MDPGAGGQQNEIGSEYRAQVGALLATAILLGDGLRHIGLDVAGTPVGISAEADLAVDDLVVQLDGRPSLCVQSKHRAQLTTGVSTPFGKAVAQFVEDHRHAVDGGPLVLAVAQGSAPLREFGAWARSLRYSKPGLLSRAQAAAADKFLTLTRRLGLRDRDEAEQLARRIHLWNVEPGEGVMHALALDRLGRAGVPTAKQTAAFEQLSNHIRRLARARAGEDLDALVAVLRADHHLDPGAVRVDAVRSALLVDEHRARLLADGRRLKSYGVPREVADVELEGADAVVDVQVPRQQDENVAREMPLERAVRRRGRAVLTGTGGCGKSTALRLLAARLAGSPDGPLPMIANWQDLRRDPDDPLGVLLTSAGRGLSPEDAVLLGMGLRRAFFRGECALLLDGLDEVTAGRDKLAMRIERWIAHAPAGTEVVVAARPFAQRAIAAFDWPLLTLLPPRQPATTAHAVIAALAVRGGHDERWVQERLGWVQNRWRRDEQLRSTPLLVVLLSVLAGETLSTESLPDTRVGLLATVIEAVVEKWEIGTRLDGRVQVGPLDQTSATYALRRALYAVAWEALVPKGDVSKRLEADLDRQLGPLTPGRLRVAAEDALAFWWSTGLFSADGDDVRAHVRPLAEAAVAQQLHDDDTDVEEILRLRDGDGPGWAVLSLLAERDEAVRAAWVAGVATDGSADELVALVDAHHDGVALSSHDVAQLIASRAVRLIDQDRVPDRVVEALLALDLAADQVEDLRAHVDHGLDLAGHPVLEALFTVRTARPASAELDRLRAFFVLPRPENRRDEQGTLLIDVPSNLHRRTLQEIALRLLRESRTDAELVASRLEKILTAGFRRQLVRQLMRAGHRDLAGDVRDATVTDGIDWGRFGDFDEATKASLEIAAAIGAPGELSTTQRRRLDELADLWASVRSQWWMPKWVERRPETLRTYLRIAVALGGFDATVISAQARSVLAELEQDPDAEGLLHDRAEARSLTRWGDVEDDDALIDEIVGIFGRVPHDCLPPLEMALVSAPHRAYVHQAITAAAETLTRVWRREATLVALVTADDPLHLARVWATEHDLRRRQAAASFVIDAVRTDHASGERLALTLLGDDDRGVVAEAAGQLAELVEVGESLPGMVLDKLQELKHSSPLPYSCQWCDSLVDARLTSCSACDTVGPSVQDQLKRALDTDQLQPPVHDATWFRERLPARRVRENRRFQ